MGHEFIGQALVAVWGGRGWCCLGLWIMMLLQRSCIRVSLVGEAVHHPRLVGELQMYHSQCRTAPDSLVGRQVRGPTSMGWRMVRAVLA